MNKQFRISHILITTILILAIVTAITVVLRAATSKKEGNTLGEAFIYNLNDLYKTDPALIKYKETNDIKTGFQEVSAIATDSSDRIYVAGDKSIRIFSNKGSVLSDIKLADQPRCLDVDNGGNIYVGMKEHIEVYDPKGTRIAKWESLGQSAILTSIAVYDNNVFVADAGNRMVLRYNVSGKSVNAIGKKKNIPGFIVPSPYFDLAVASDGLLRVVNPGVHKIEAYTFEGDLEFSWGETSTDIKGFSGCCNPVNFAILPNGKFVTCEKGLPRVKIFSANGVFESVVAGAESFVKNKGICISEDTSECQTGGLDVAVDSLGRVLVLDPHEKTIRIFTLL